MTAVWLYGTRIGELTRPRRGRVRFDFTDDAQARWGQGSHVLSMSMPVTTAVRPTGDVIAAYISNLFPEGDALTAMRTTYQAFDDYELLNAIGRDTAGALIVADDPSPGLVTTPEYLSEDEIARLLFELPTHPLGASTIVRHSIAGAQRKLLLGRSADGRWYRPTPSSPSTHLLKPAPLDHPEVATNEAFCMEIARRAGLDVCPTEQLRTGSTSVLVAQRFDRVGGTRIHQEDGCQMLGLPPGRKYERRGPANKIIGPSLTAIARVLSPPDRVRLLEAQVLNVLVGNADGHGKNVSVLHHDDGRVSLAPLYDVMSTVVHHPVLTVDGPKALTTQLGMAVGGARHLDEVTVDHLVTEAARWPIPRTRAASAIRSAVERVVEAANATGEMYPEIADLVRRQAAQLLNS
jgi:serine/threonine-protein kinase HipA